MRGLSSTPSRNRRSNSTCSFCRSPEHQVTACQHVKPIWESLQQGIIPLTYMSHVEDNDTSGMSNTWRANNSYWVSPLSTYYTNGGTWGELYTAAEKAYEKWERAQQRQNTPKAKRTILQTCGYCKETGHTRSKCSHVKSHKELLAKGNTAFRKWFYEEYVEKQGLSTGAIISFDFVSSGRWNVPDTRTKIQTIVTDINWDSINLLSLLDMDTNVSLTYRTEIDGAKQEKLGNIRNFLRSDVLCKVPSTALSQCEVTTAYSYRYNKESLTFYGIPVGISPYKSVLKHFSNQDSIGYGENSNVIENFTVVQRAPQVLSDDWIDGFSDQMSVMFSKFTMAQLEFFGVIEHIKLWAAKEQ